MSIRVMYHSSTGNTRKIANAIADMLHVEAEPIGKNPVSFSKSVDLLFIGDGIYGGKANKKTIAFINQLTPATVKNVAVFATYGGQARIGESIRTLLQEKKLNVVGEPFTCKGRAWGILNRRHPDENDMDMARQYAKRIVAEINHP